MRWSGQEIGVVDHDALPGLGRLSDLVRSVQAPEFADTIFHEVLAKSALNRVPGASTALPFGWTINPYRGCLHRCVFCLDPETLILMADGRLKPLRQVRIGDEVIGTRSAGRDRYATTTVRAAWGTRKLAYRVTLADGTEITASADHRLLSDRGWTHVAGAAVGAARRPHLTIGTSLLGFGLAGPGRLDRPVKLPIEGRAVTSSDGLRVESVEPVGEMDLIDIATGTGDFVANGIVSHNCFARPTHTYLGLDAGRDFDTQIVVKVNVVEVLQRELARGGWQRSHVALGTNTDPYQRAEGRYRLMPGIIAALAASGTPFSILTKGTLLRRDLPLLREAAERVPVHLAMTIDVFDPELRASVEPGAPTVLARLATVRDAVDAGFDVSVLIMPVLPYLTDSIAHLDEALGMIAAAGASSVAYTALHLRPGAREWYFAWLEREHPELVPRYRDMYARSAYAPKGYRQWLARRIQPLLRRHGLDRRPRMDPSTGAPAPAPPAGGDRYPTGHEMPPSGLIAAELPPAVAAAIQPTLF